MEVITLAGGCFWCLEASYQLVKGVKNAIPGYAGGKSGTPTYWTVHGNTDGWAEAVQVTFDPSVISLEDILDIFWVIHDPTTLNKQGPDTGPEYRSLILAHDTAQLEKAKVSRDKAQKVWNDPIVTELLVLDRFVEAEEEHHDFYKKHPEMAYCQVIINPKLEKLRAKFAERLKP